MGILNLNIPYSPSDVLEHTEEFVKLFIEGAAHLNQVSDSDKVFLFNKERHTLYPHQVDAVRASILEVVLSSENHSGYCFMPTSAGKSYIIIALAAMAVGNFDIFREIERKFPGFLESSYDIFPLLCNLSFLHSIKVGSESTKQTQILVHDVEILGQLSTDTESRLPPDIFKKIDFYSVQSHRSEWRRKDLRYLIIDECHWGNASQDETIQSSLVADLKEVGGKCFGFTASPYENPDGKFQKTWSKNKINSDRDFNYYLEKNIIYPITLREVTLQNARIDYELGDDEIELTEKDEIIEFMASNILETIPRVLDGPAICFFSHVIIPEIVGKLLEKSKSGYDLSDKIRVLGSPEAAFIEKCKANYGHDILASEDTIEKLKSGEKIFLISQQKLLVGLNAPYLRYCFISPTNSKIKILQGIGRLMRPIDFNEVPKKLATLFLASLSGKKMDIGEGSGESEPREECNQCGLKICDCPCKECGEPRNTACGCPKARYVTTSLTLSQAYDLPIKVFYRTEVGFRDFVNQNKVDDPNSVFRIGTNHIPKEDLDKFDAVDYRRQLNALRDNCKAAYRQTVLERDNHSCQGKRLLGEVGCTRGMGEVSLEIHHMHPYEFNALVQKYGIEGTREWHSKPSNWEYLVTLCIACHDLIHSKSFTENDDNEDG